MVEGRNNGMNLAGGGCLWCLLDDPALALWHWHIEKEASHRFQKGQINQRRIIKLA
jgi:hypothetical protein